MTALGSEWLGLFNDQPWVAEASCPSTDPEIFHPEKGGSTAEAKKVCMGCVVRQECLDWALETDQRHGVLGGYSERERRKLRRGQDVPLRVRAEVPEKRCEWCRKTFRGKRRYCNRSCSSLASRARKKDAA